MKERDDIRGLPGWPKPIVVNVDDAGRRPESVFCAGEALATLPEFARDVREALDQWEDAAELFGLHVLGHGDPSTHFTHPPLPDEEQEERVQALGQAIGALQERWGMATWPERRQITQRALGIVRPEVVEGLGYVFGSIGLVRIIRLPLEVQYTNSPLEAVEAKAIDRMIEELREAYRRQSSAKRPGRPIDQEVAKRNLQWYFLHAQGLSCQEVARRWNELHPHEKPLDPYSESDLAKMRNGVSTIGRRYGVQE